MDTRLTDKIYIEKKEIEKEYKQSWIDFLAGDETTEFEEAYQKVEKLLNTADNGWIVMEDDWVYDNKIKACWYGLCKKKKYLDFSSDINLNNTLEKVKKHHRINKHFDLATKTELTKSIVKIKKAPFEHQNNGRQTVTSNEYVLYKKAVKIQGYDSASGYLKDSSHGYAIPLLRLTSENNFKISNRKAFFRFIALDLVPTALKDDKDYKLCLDRYKAFDIQIKNYTTITEVKLKEDAKLKFSSKALIEKLLNEDKIRADIKPYNEKMLDDTEQGHWSLWKDKDDLKNPVTVTLNKKFVARDPKSSIIDGTVGIDFGTKSTVVVYQKETTKIYPMRIGTGDLSKTIASTHYENPTILEFNNLAQFEQDYKTREGRPETKWQDLTISHTAQNSLLNAKSDDFNAYISELKQWAGNKDKKLKMVDKQGYVLDLPPFLELDENDTNPIEIYAYYLGLYINNHNNGIFLNYILSFPVTYELSIRDKIIESFYKGIKKSLPQELHNQPDEINKLSIIKGASEPAAYAVVALQEYGFEPEDEEKIFYGVFDFGGGTTDFDFGIYREANEDVKKERRFDYVIEHFGAGGDRYLGGENLLELLAFEIFKKNRDKLLEKSIQFILPPECDEFLGGETLLSLSREAKLNTKTLMEKLRPFWEGVEDEMQNFENGTIEVNLSDVDAKQHVNFELDIDLKEMIEILSNRIYKGVQNFFHSLRLAFDNRKIDLSNIEVINIFLAGNSSKSMFVKRLFEQEIAKQTLEFKESTGTDKEIFKIYDPLGADKGNLEKPTGKTGVAFGLIETREGGDILVIDHNTTKNKDIAFKYYLGESKKKKFKVKIGRDTKYNEWIAFTDASYKTFELYISSQSIVSTNKTKIDDSAIKKRIFTIDTVDEDALVYIRVVSPSEIEYVVAMEDGIKNEQYLGEIQKVVLKGK